MQILQRGRWHNQLDHDNFFSTFFVRKRLGDVVLVLLRRRLRLRTPEPEEAPSPRVGHDTSLFSKLVLGYIETKFCNQTRILEQFSKSTKVKLSS